ncbi:unnamed protein product [Bathycoccus prasinos]
MVVAGESGKKKVNIGVLLMRNGAAVQEFLRRILSKVSEGHWDQGVACCMLNKKSKYKCKGISRFKGIKYRFFPASIVDVEERFHFLENEAMKKLLRNLGNYLMAYSDARTDVGPNDCSHQRFLGGARFYAKPYTPLFETFQHLIESKRFPPDTI